MQARREKKDKQPISHLSKKEFAQDESVEAGLPLRANTVVPTSSDASSVKSNVTRIENLYIKALIPEMVIMDKSQKELQNTIEYLENLKRLLLKLREQQYPELDELERSRAASIYDRINEDVALYTQFVDPSFVNLERILQESEADSISADQHRDMIDFGYDHAVHSGPSVTFPSNQTSTRGSLHAGSLHFSVNSIKTSASRQSIRETERHTESRLFSIPPGPAGVFKWTVLRKLSASIKSWQETFGKPTCFQVKSQRIFFGTEKSAVLVYDVSQNLLGVLDPGSEMFEKRFGVVTCVDCSPDASVFIVGHNTGYITLWDGKGLRMIKCIDPAPMKGKDGHIEGTPIVFVNAYSRDKFYSADEYGSAFYHSFSSRLVFYSSFISTQIHGKRDKKGIFPLPPSTTIHSILPLPKCGMRMFSDPYQLVAITSPVKIAILAMKPNPHIQFRASWAQMNYSDSELDIKEAHSEVSWWCPQSSSDDLNFRRLAFSHGSHLALLKVMNTSSNDPSRSKLSFKIACRTKAVSDVLAIEWISEKFLLCCVANDTVQIFDSSNLCIIEHVSLSPRTLIPNPPLEPLAFLQKFGLNRDFNIHHSVCCYFNRLFILSDDEVAFASLVSWQERLAILIKAGRFEEAFKIGIQLLRGKSVIVALQIPSTATPQGLELVSSHMHSLIMTLVTMTTAGFDPSKSDDEASSYKPMLVKIFETSLELEKSDVLLQIRVWEQYSKKEELACAFIEVLQDFILQDKIRSIVNPVLFDRMVTMCDPKTLEQVLLRLDPRYLSDALQVCSICEELGLFNALVYIYNQALGDFVTPYFKILKSISATEETEKSKETLDLLFIYLAHISCGKAFPFGLLDEEQSLIASRGVLSVLFSPALLFQHHQETESSNEPWPYFSFLLHKDFTEMLKVLGTIFVSPLLDNGIPLTKDVMEIQMSAAVVDPDALLITRQYIIGILLVWFKSSSWSGLEKESLCCFICKSYKHFKSHIVIAYDDLMDIFNYLLDCTTVSTSKERELAIMCLFDTDFTPVRLELDNNLYLERFKRAQFWRLFENQVLQENNFDLAIMSYLRGDSNRRFYLFDSIRKWIKEAIDVADREAIKNSFEKYLVDLSFDCHQLAKLVNELWPHYHQKALEKLDSASLQFAYLEGLLGPVKNLVALDLASVTRRDIPHRLELYETYLKLLFSQSTSSHVVGYLDYCLGAFKTMPFSLAKVEVLANNNNDVLVRIWCLLQRKEITSALKVLLEKLLPRLEMVKKGEENLDVLGSELHKAVEICELSSKSDKESWLVLLINVFFPLHKFLPNCTKSQVWHSTMTIITKHLSVPDILLYLINEEPQERISSHLPLFGYLLGDFENEIQSLDQTLTLSQVHAFEEFKSLVSAFKSSYHANLGQCQLCRKFFHLRAMTLEEQKGEIVICKCNHAFHMSCLTDVLEKVHFRMKIPGLVDDYDFWCIVCGMPSDRKKKGKQKEIFTSMTDLTNGIGESNRALVDKLILVDKTVYARKDMLSCLKDLSTRGPQQKTHDQVFINDSPIDDFARFL